MMAPCNPDKHIDSCLGVGVRPQDEEELGDM